MSRATTSGPVSATRVRTGYLVSSARISSIGRFRSMATTSPSASAGLEVRQVLRRVGLQLLEEHPVRG